MSAQPSIAELDRGQQPGDILLFYRPTGASRLISLFTRSPFYHVAICVDTLHVVEARPRGVVIRDLRSNEGGHTFVVIPMRDSTGQRALEWAKKKLGSRYDRTDVLVLLLDRIFARFHINYRPSDRSFTCGEFVARAFEAVGCRLFPDIEAVDALPADFARLLPQAEAASRPELCAP